MILITPQFITVQRWAAETTSALLPYGSIPILQDADNWRSWADAVAALPALAALHAPRSDPFATWQAWALQFNAAVQLLTT